MTEEQIKEMLDAIGIEHRYHHFETAEAVNPPFICWIIPGTTNFSADGVAYVSAKKLKLELYSDEKDSSLEARVENQLNINKIFWSKVETYIESESMYETIYEMEV